MGDEIAWSVHYVLYSKCLCHLKSFTGSEMWSVFWGFSISTNVISLIQKANSCFFLLYHCCPIDVSDILAIESVECLFRNLP